MTAIRDGFVGWQGFGGSVFQWHPEANVSFSYVPAHLCLMDFANTRAGLLQQAVMKSINKK